MERNCLSKLGVPSLSVLRLPKAVSVKYLNRDGFGLPQLRLPPDLDGGIKGYAASLGSSLIPKQ
ncbi:unnamed protein product [Tenebrio molitor]|nr:unnamed protein product [Tenebrio molitor]